MVGGIGSPTLFVICGFLVGCSKPAMPPSAASMPAPHVTAPEHPLPPHWDTCATAVPRCGDPIQAFGIPPFPQAEREGEQVERYRAAATACEAGSAEACRAYLDVLDSVSVAVPEDHAGPEYRERTRIEAAAEQRAWLRGCQGGDPAACEGVARALAEPPPDGDAVAWRRCTVDLVRVGCEGGGVQSCEILGRVADPEHPVFHPTCGQAALVRACDLGASRSCRAAGEALMGGLAVPVDPNAGRAHRLGACRLGDPLGCDALGLELVAEDPAQALEALDLACGAGMGPACLWGRAWGAPTPPVVERVRATTEVGWASLLEPAVRLARDDHRAEAASLIGGYRGLIEASREPVDGPDPLVEDDAPLRVAVALADAIGLTGAPDPGAARRWLEGLCPGPDPASDVCWADFALARGLGVESPGAPSTDEQRSAYAQDLFEVARVVAPQGEIVGPALKGLCDQGAPWGCYGFAVAEARGWIHGAQEAGIDTLVNECEAHGASWCAQAYAHLGDEDPRGARAAERTCEGPATHRRPCHRHRLGQVAEGGPIDDALRAFAKRHCPVIDPVACEALWARSGDPVPPLEPAAHWTLCEADHAPSCRALADLLQATDPRAAAVLREPVSGEVRP